MQPHLYCAGLRTEFQAGTVAKLASCFCKVFVHHAHMYCPHACPRSIMTCDSELVYEETQGTALLQCSCLRLPAEVSQSYHN